MSRKLIITAALGSALALASLSGANAAPIGGQIQNAVQSGANTAEIMPVHHRGKKRFRHFKFHKFHYYPYYGGCYWLKKKARRTGSKYWWNRYYNCLYFY